MHILSRSRSLLNKLRLRLFKERAVIIYFICRRRGVLFSLIKSSLPACLV